MIEQDDANTLVRCNFHKMGIDLENYSDVFYYGNYPGKKEF